MPSFVRVMFSFSLQIWNTFGIRWNKLFRAKTSHQCISAAAAILDFFDNKGQIFDSLVHPLKLVQIKNPFGILQTNPQIPQKWVGLFYFQKNMFCWDTLVVIFPRYLFKNVHRYLWQYFKLRDILPNCTGSLGSKLKDTKSFINIDFGAICGKREF